MACFFLRITHYDWWKQRPFTLSIPRLADRLIKEVRDAIVYSTRNIDAPSQRRVLRNHGARYYYLPDENVDMGDETAVFLWYNGVK